MTVQGAILGTCPYMAPELLEGKSADARCDIFAFGAVLYEMITGRRAFQGGSQPLIIASILEHEPPPITAMLQASAGSSVAALDHLVRTCLAKDPDERRQTAHDVLLELRWIAAGGSQADRRRSRISLAALCGGIVLVFGLLVYFAVVHRGPRAEPRLLRVSVLPPEKTTFVASSLPALSPDGRRMVFAASSEGKTQLWVRNLDSLQAAPIPGTESGYHPFWSPDSAAVGFFSTGKLRKVKLSGGPAVALCDAQQGRGGSWSPNGTIVFAPLTGDALYRISADGGVPTRITTLDASLEQVSHRWPWFLPDGHHYLYTGRSSDPARNAIFVADLESPQKARVLEAGSNAAFAPPGFLLFVRERTLMAVNFDAAKLRTAGEPFPVASPVDLITANVQGNFSASQSGTVVYYSGGAGLNSQLTWFDRAGQKLGVTGEPGSFVQPAISPNGEEVVVDKLDSLSGTYDIWLYDLARGAASRMTFDRKQDGYPVWSPDGSHIVFASDRRGVYNLYEKSVGGAAKEELLLESPLPKFPCDWSRDGRYLIYYQIDPKTKYDLWVLQDPLGPAAGRKPFPYLTSEFDEHRAKLSPDGNWLAYASNETSRDEVYVQSFPSPGNKWRVSVNGGSRPVWRRDGKELFYIAPDRKLMVAAVTPKPRFQTGQPAPLFETRLSLTRFFDVTPDGNKFLLVDPMQDAATPMTLLVDWTAAIQHH